MCHVTYEHFIDFCRNNCSSAIVPEPPCPPKGLLTRVWAERLDEIVLMFLTAMETDEAITKMVQTFKCMNPKRDNTKVVITDKDFNKRAVLSFLMLHYTFAYFMS